MGPLSPEACRRLACDGALTRVVVTRQPSHHGLRGDHGHEPDGHHGPPLEDNPSARGTNPVTRRTWPGGWRRP
jgi:hypothetical protein